MKTSRILAATALVAAFAVSAAYAQQQQAQRLSGTIEKVEGNTITGKARDGAAITLKLPDNVVVTAVLPATAADIKPGAYIGRRALRHAGGCQADGRQLHGRAHQRRQERRSAVLSRKQSGDSQHLPVGPPGVRVRRLFSSLPPIGPISLIITPISTFRHRLGRCVGISPQTPATLQC